MSLVCHRVRESCECGKKWGPFQWIVTPPQARYIDRVQVPPLARYVDMIPICDIKAHSPPEKHTIKATS
jgi:hypothetical protein